MSPNRAACVVLFPGVEELDALGPFETLCLGARAGAPLDVTLVAREPGERIECAMGATVLAHGPVPDDVDLLVVPGGGWSGDASTGARAAVEDGGLPRLVAERHARGSTVASVCTGALIVAASGIARGRPMTTHHTALDDLRARGVEVRHDRVVDDGDLLSCGGITSGIDLALHYLRREFGSTLVAAVEDELEYRPRSEGHFAPG
ncbi:MAG: DJ-1/PfpI family protein [Miltoncostaeaceae bacterium]